MALKFTPRERMENPLLGQEPLPQFLRIRPEHVEPAVREVLTQNRARIEELASLPIPTFATLIEPLEELQHRVSRTWSPVSHLNAVLNSDALRTGYNACLPLLSAYQTDLAQSEPLFRAYRTIADQEGAALAPVQRQVIEHAMRDFRLAGVGLPVERKERFKSAMLELTQLQAKFEENVLDATNAWTWQVADPQQLRGLNDMLIEQARRRAHERGALLVGDGVVGPEQRLALREVGLIGGQKRQAGVVTAAQRSGIQHRVQVTHRRPGARNAVLQLLQRLDERCEGGYRERGELLDARAVLRQHFPHRRLDVFGTDLEELRQGFVAQ